MLTYSCYGALLLPAGSTIQVVVVVFLSPELAFFLQGEDAVRTHGHGMCVCWMSTGRKKKRLNVKSTKVYVGMLAAPSLVLV